MPKNEGRMPMVHFADSQRSTLATMCLQINTKHTDQTVRMVPAGEKWWYPEVNGTQFGSALNYLEALAWLSGYHIAKQRLA